MVILYHAKSNTLLEETQDRLSRLFRLTIQTGLLTTVIAIPIGPLFRHDGFQRTYLLPLFLLGKSYVLSLLANLNARNTDHTTIPKRVNGGEETVNHLSNLAFTPGVRNQQTRSGMNMDSVGSRGGILSFIRSVGRSNHNNLTHPMTEFTSGLDPSPQLELAHEGCSNVAHEILEPRE